MSLIQKIKSRRVDDLINEGYRTVLTGTLGAGNDQPVMGIPNTKAVIITGYVLSAHMGTPLVTMTLKSPTQTNVMFLGYVSATAPINKTYSAADWIYGELYQSLLISTTAAVTYTIDVRVISPSIPIGYIEGDGAKGHTAPHFADENGRKRGQTDPINDK